MYFVYVLQSLKDKKLYTGTSNDLKKRLERHNKGLVKATKFRRPFKLVYYEASLNLKDAYKREVYLKSAWGKRYIKGRLKNYFGGHS
ncbi:MAG TPA: GIY-YIG nuclease family protein [Patescibacteria group bacterium]|nr:GIY-YIG nuclease family protein [Patescibacteria group bacterium]